MGNQRNSSRCLPIKENGETDYEDIDHSEEIAEMDQRIRKLLEE